MHVCSGRLVAPVSSLSASGRIYIRLYLSLIDVSLGSHVNPTVVRLLLKQSKQTRFVAAPTSSWVALVMTYARYRRCLPIAAEGLNCKGFPCHSFPISAIPTAKAKGVSDSTVKSLGRWRSDAFQLYIRLTDADVATASSQLTGVISVLYICTLARFRKVN